MLLEASGHSPSCVVVFSVIQDSLETSGHSIHQRCLQDSCTPWIAERGATVGFISCFGSNQFSSPYRTVRLSRTMSNQVTNWFYKSRAAPIKFCMVRRGTARLLTKPYLSTTKFWWYFILFINACFKDKVLLKDFIFFTTALLLEKHCLAVIFSVRFSFLVHFISVLLYCMIYHSHLFYYCHFC